MRVGLGPKLGGVDVVQLVEMVADAERVEHAAGIRLVAVGEDELAARQAGKAARQPVVARDPVERDGVDVVEEFVRVDVDARASARPASCHASWKCAFWTRLASAGSQPSSRSI